MKRAGLGPRVLSALRAWTLVRAPTISIRCLRPDDRELGLWGEEIAARHLVRSGWRVLGRRVRTPAAEVDLVARDGAELVCVEVKTARVRPALAPSGGPTPRGGLAPHGGLAPSGVEPDERGPDLRWRPGARCDARQLARLARAGRFLAHGRPHASDREQTRVDLIEVWLEARRGRWRLVHHRDLRRPLG